MFWFCCYLGQSNPLIGPRLRQTVVLIMSREWGSELQPEPEMFEPKAMEDPDDIFL